MAESKQKVDEIAYATPIQAEEMITDCLSVNKVPMVKGSPGIGKSQLFKFIADKFKLFLIDIRLSTHDITDLTGYPWADLEAGKMKFLPPDMFPLRDTPIPEGYEGWLILFDELNSAGDEKQAASYKVILDKMVHQSLLHPKVRMAAAGNLATDNAIVNELSTAMQSRLIHIRMQVNFDAFMQWAGRADLDYRMKGFLNFRPASLHDFNPDHEGDTYACPRTWHFVSDFLKLWGDDGKILTPTRQLTLNGTVGPGHAHQFGVFLDVYKDLVKFEDIVANPTTIAVPSKLDVQCAVGSLIANKADEVNIKPCLQYVERMPAEFQAVTLKDLIRRVPEMFTNEHVTTWRKDHALEFFG